jgi:AcrR family transcriptional regulator
MDDIAGAAALTKRTLYYHFKSKDTLLADVLEAQHALALEALASATGSVDHQKRSLTRCFTISPFGQIRPVGRVPALHGS